LTRFTTDPMTLLSVSTDKSVSYNTVAICESLGCNNKATVQVTVGVGRLGNIDLNLCNDCAPIFKNTGKLAALQEQLTSGRMADPDDILLSTT
jgi:hypothetical protein